MYLLTFYILYVAYAFSCWVQLNMYILCSIILSILYFDINIIIGLCWTEQDIIRLPRLFRFLQKPLAQFISVVRAPKSKEGYASIGGGSPLRRITDAQAWFNWKKKIAFLLDFHHFLCIRVRLYFKGHKLYTNVDLKKCCHLLMYFCFVLVLSLAIISCIQAEELRKSLWEKNLPAKVYVGMRYWHPFTEEAIEQVSCQHYVIFKSIFFFFFNLIFKRLSLLDPVFLWFCYTYTKSFKVCFLCHIKNGS